MKSLNNYVKKYISESLLDDEDVLLTRTDRVLIERWIRDHYKVLGELIFENDPKDSNILLVSVKRGDVTLTTQSDYLTNGTFRWHRIDYDFSCTSRGLKSLEGAPDYVGGNFYCMANNITNLIGCPRIIAGSCYLNNNFHLETLEGGPERVSGDFNCPDRKSTRLNSSHRL